MNFQKWKLFSGSPGIFPVFIEKQEILQNTPIVRLSNRFGSLKSTKVSSFSLASETIYFGIEILFEEAPLLWIFYQFCHIRQWFI